jgi:iron complex outermembrane receptor protein
MMVVAVFGCGWVAYPEDAVAPPKETTAKEDISRSELLAFEDLPIVVSASRQAEKQGTTSVPVSVFTKDDIHYSGAMVLPDVFAFIPGVDVLQFDRNRYAVGVRGMHDYFSDRTLTLINGRSAENPGFGGAEYLVYPVLLEDIERIEVVRGPGGAAWGANALNGVVNIITKKPEDTQGVLAGTAVDAFGDTSSYVRWGAKKGNWAWRTSFGYSWFETSEDAIHEDDFASSDYHRDAMFDGEAAVKLSSDTRVSFGAGYMYKNHGDFETAGVFVNEENHVENLRSFVKAEHDFGNDMQGYVQWFGNFAKDDLASLTHVTTSQNDWEGQLTFKPAQRHRMTVGSNIRWVSVDARQERSTDVTFLGGPLDEYQAGAFVLDRWEVNDRLTFEGQARGDWYSGTQADWAARLSVLFAADSRKDHVLRFSGARSFRAPYCGVRLIESESAPTPFGFSAFNLHPNPDLDNEGIWSWELGYTGRLMDGLTVRLDGYVQRYEGLIGFDNELSSVTLLPPFPPISIPVIDTQADNIDGATAYGGELELAYRWKWGLLSAWYSHHELEPDRSVQPMRAYLSSPDSAGLSCRLFLPHQVTLNLNYRGDFGTIVNQQGEGDAQGHQRIDATVTKRFSGERFELQLGVRDLLDQTGEAVGGVSSTTKHDVAGRTFFARFQVKF